MNRNSKTRTNIAKVARGAVITALGCVFLMISYPFEALDLTAASLAALLIWIVRLEYGGVFALVVYAATAVLCMIVTPGNSGTVCYALVFGWYPVYKALIERKIPKKPLQWLLKLFAVTAAFALMIALFFTVFVGEVTFEDAAKSLSLFFSADNGNAGWFEERVLFGINRLQWMMVAVYLVFAPLITLIYDLLLTKFAIIYVYKIRPVLVKAHIF